ncbi:TPA: serine hydrolase [Candidatus Woesearchaeota archaeon]|nr:serine hydrolase [Candidatus Woesearchaeota archaeon]
MRLKLRWIAVFELVIIIALIILLSISFYGKPAVEANELKNEFNDENTPDQLNLLNNSSGLLSPRIYAGILEPKSFMISHFSNLQDAIQKYINDNNISASVYVQNLRNGAAFGINQREGVFPASINKLPIAILVLQDVEKGKLNFTTPILIEASLITETSDQIYRENSYLPLKDLLERMLSESDNTAYYQLSNNIDEQDLRLLTTYYGLDGEGIYSWNKEKWLNNPKLSPRLLANIFSSLYFSTVLEPKNSEYLLSLLTNTSFDIHSISHLPQSITISQKYGYYDVDGISLLSDCGIMYINQSRILYCISIRNADRQKSLNAIGAMINAIYSYVTQTRSTLDLFKKQGYISPPAAP